MTARYLEENPGMIPTFLAWTTRYMVMSFTTIGNMGRN